MFGIGMTEMLLIAGLALIVLGPKKLPELAKSLGKGFAEFKRATNELKQTIDLETRAEEDRYKNEQREKESKLTPPQSAPITEEVSSSYPQEQPQPGGIPDKIREAKLAQTQYAEEDAELERELKQGAASVIEEAEAEGIKEQKQDV